jgi:hypothetical protein
VHLVGFIIRKFVTIHGHMIVKLITLCSAFVVIRLAFVQSFGSEVTQAKLLEQLSERATVLRNTALPIVFSCSATFYCVSNTRQIIGNKSSTVLSRRACQLHQYYVRSHKRVKRLLPSTRLSVRLSVRMYQLGHHWMKSDTADFH